MSRIGVTAFLSLFLVLIGAGAAAGQVAQAITTLFSEPVEVESVNIVNTDGTSVSGGLFGGQVDGECGVGTEAFVRKLDSDGADDWLRCHRSSAQGSCQQKGGTPLFDDFTSVDSAYIVASTVRGADVDESTGEIAVTGELLMACPGGPNLEVSRAAFLALFDTDGNLILDTYLGETPDCEPPGPEVCCEELCDEGGFGGGGQCDGYDIALGPTAIAFTGKCVLPNSPTGWDVVVASYSRTLVPNWFFTGGFADTDVGLGVEVDDQGEIWATGWTTSETERRDLFVSRHRASDGVLESVLLDGGPLDDEGRAVQLGAAGELEVELVVRDEATFGDETLGEPDGGYQGYNAVLDRETLEPLYVDAMEESVPDPMEPKSWQPGHTQGASRGSHKMSMLPPPPPPPPPEGPEPPEEMLTMTGCRVTIGETGGGCQDVLTQSGEGGTLNLTAVLDANEMVAELEVDFLPAQWPFTISGTSLRVEAEFCYTASIWVNGLLDDEDVLLGVKEICPIDQPVLSAEISAEDSAQFGLNGLDLPIAEEVLTVITRFEFYYCPICSSQAKECSVDELEVEVDF